MDVETTLLLVSAVFGIVGGSVACLVGILHIYGWLPKRYTDRLEAVQRGVAVDVGVEVGKALERVAAQQTATLEAAATDAEKSMQMSMVRSVGVDKVQQQAMSNMLAEGMLQNVLPILRVIVPGIADQLEENPQLIFTLIDNPFFKRYVLPRIQQFLPMEMGGGGAVSTGAGQVSGSGWG